MSSQDLADTRASTTPSTTSQTSSTEPADGYPKQLHAGKVGYGPEYGKGVSAGAKISGLKEEVMGKVKHDPSLVQHGHDMRTGTLARKEREEADKDLFPDAQPAAGSAPAAAETTDKPKQNNVSDAGIDSQDKFDQERSGAIEADREGVPERDQHARENVRI